MGKFCIYFIVLTLVTFTSSRPHGLKRRAMTSTQEPLHVVSPVLKESRSNLGSWESQANSLKSESMTEKESDILTLPKETEVDLTKENALPPSVKEVISPKKEAKELWSFIQKIVVLSKKRRIKFSDQWNTRLAEMVREDSSDNLKDISSTQNLIDESKIYGDNVIGIANHLIDHLIRADEDIKKSRMLIVKELSQLVLNDSGLVKKFLIRLKLEKSNSKEPKSTLPKKRIIDTTFRSKSQLSEPIKNQEIKGSFSIAEILGNEIIEAPEHPNFKSDDETTKFEANIENQKMNEELQKIEAQKTSNPNLLLTDVKDFKNQINTYEEPYSIENQLKSNFKILNRQVDEEKNKKGNSLSNFEIKITDLVESLMNFSKLSWLKSSKLSRLDSSKLSWLNLEEGNHKYFSLTEEVKLEDLEIKLNVERQNIESSIKKRFKTNFEIQTLLQKPENSKILQETFQELIKNVENEDWEMAEDRAVRRMRSKLSHLRTTGDPRVFLPKSSITLGGT